MPADPTRDLSMAALYAPTRVEITLCRLTCADRAVDAADAAQLLDMLGLGAAAGPRTRMADLPHEQRLDLHVRRDPTAPPVTAPDSAAVLRARQAAKKRRMDAARTHLRAQGLTGRQLGAAMARMGS